MKRPHFIIATAIAACVSAAPTAIAQGPGWAVPATVIRLVNTANRGVNVRLSPDLANCVSQSGYGAVYASILPNHPALNRMKADLLYAFATGTRVSLYLSDAELHCWRDGVGS